MPRRYARCVGVNCADPGLTPFEPGQRVKATVSTWGASSAYAEQLTRVVR